MLIDTHQHVFWHSRDDKGLIADMDHHGIDLAWLLTWEISQLEANPGWHRILNPIHLNPDGTHPGIVLSDLLLAREHYPNRFIVGYCPHPLRGDAPGLLESAVKIHRVRVCGEWKFRIPFDDPRCINLFHKAGELNLPVVLHLDVPYMKTETGQWEFKEQWFGGTVANLERALQACPKTTFIGHAPGFWREISGDADDATTPYPTGPVKPGGRIQTLLDRYENLYADLSAGSGLGALKRDPAHAARFLTRYADRLLFARDYYETDLWDFVKTLELTPNVVTKLCESNALKLVPLN